MQKIVLKPGDQLTISGVQMTVLEVVKQNIHLGYTGINNKHIAYNPLRVAEFTPVGATTENH